jgi:hypothetical protein
MRRPPHGATTRPGPDRPASGYGGPLGRPGPCSAGAVPAAEPVEAGPLGADQAVISASAVASPGEPGPVPAI